MPRTQILRAAFTIALLVAVVSTVLGMAGISGLREAFSSVRLSSLLAALALLGGGILLSSLRLKLITDDLGYSLTFRDSVTTLCVSQLAGTVFFQFAGQLLARGAMFSERGIPPAATIVISGYERLVALAVSVALAACGGIYLFGKLSLDLNAGGVSLIKLAAGTTVAVVGGALFAWGGPFLRAARQLSHVSALKLLRSLAISLAIQLATLGAYVAIERTFAPHIDIWSLAAASCVIMLAASLPISLGGWGLREVSAVVALQAIGMSSAAALLVALMIGLMSISMVGATALVLELSGSRPMVARARNEDAQAPDYGAILDWALPVLAATAVFIQVHLPTNSGHINVNLADPLVMVAAALFVLRHAGKAWPQWRVRGINLFVALATAVIALSFVRGWASFGLTDWAFANKTLGWLVLLCYGMTGALIVRRAAEDGFEMLLATFVAVGAALALLDVTAWVMVASGASWLKGMVGYQITGLSQNPNAFGFALLLALAAGLAMRAGGRIGAPLIAIALVGIWYTGSRAGIGTAIIMLAAGPFVGVSIRRIAASIGGAAVIFAGIAALALLANTNALLLPQRIADFWPAPEAGAGFLGSIVRMAPGSDYVHLRTVIDGFAMFLANPVLGAGLGAFTHRELAATGTPLLIHSSPVWLLAETGLVGFLVFAVAAARIGWLEMRRTGDVAARFLLLSLLAFAAMSMVHELLYQRAMWLLWGAALALPALRQSPEVSGPSAGKDG